jgi:hypothetical protein
VRGGAEAGTTLAGHGAAHPSALEHGSCTIYGCERFCEYSIGLGWRGK